MVEPWFLGFVLKGRTIVRWLVRIEAARRKPSGLVR